MEKIEERGSETFDGLILTLGSIIEIIVSGAKDLLQTNSYAEEKKIPHSVSSSDYTVGPITNHLHRQHSSQEQSVGSARA